MRKIALSETYVDPLDKAVKVTDSFPICPSFGAVYYTTLDFGFPAVRESVQDLPQADGTYDETQYTGARNITLEGIIAPDFGDEPVLSNWPTDIQWNSTSYWISTLTAWASPARRYRLFFEDEIGRNRFMDVRGSGFNAKVEKFSDQKREFQLQMVNPSGKIYSMATGEGTTLDWRYKVPILMEGGEEDGITPPFIPPLTFPPGIVGETEIKYGGTVPNGVLIEINTGNGTMQGPRVRFTSPTGLVSDIGLDISLTIPAGATLSIDTVNRTVSYRMANSSTEQNVSQYLRAPLQWPQLRPGINRSALDASANIRGFNKVEFNTAADTLFDPSATMNVIYHEADLG